MRRFLIFFISALFFANPAWSGGIMTNTNQSASYIRMPARGASLGIDAVYYNPAGLTRLGDGIHLSLNNQSVFQNRNIYNELSILNRNEFEGVVSAPFFPSVHAAYKTGKLAVSFGFNPVGGGGGAVYDDGLPSFDAMIAATILATPGMNDYRHDIYFEGSSIFFGSQLGLSYEINEIVSVFGGARYVVASNSYDGYVRNIEGQHAVAGWMPIPFDIEVDAVQRGTGITPLVGLSIKPGDRFNLGIKYEFLTKLELENETSVDGTDLFPDGVKTRSDMPAMLSLGAAYLATPDLNIAGGIHYYFDKAADYGKALPNEELIDNNFIELALGLEYSLAGNLLVSAGYLRTQTGVNENYQSDLSHSLSTNSIGLGGRYAINEMIALNLGFLMTFYEEDSIEFPPQMGSAIETYNRDGMVVAVGVDFKF